MPRFPDSAPSSHSLSDSVCGKLVERSTPEGNENGKLLLFGRLAFLLSLGAVGGGDFGDDWIPAGLEELVGFLLDERHPAAFGHPANLGALPCGPWWPRFLAGKYGSALDLDGAAQYAMLPAG
jgi:hypothetical protein